MADTAKPDLRDVVAVLEKKHRATFERTTRGEVVIARLVFPDSSVIAGEGATTADAWREVARKEALLYPTTERTA